MGDAHTPPFNAWEIWLTTDGANSWNDITPFVDGAGYGLVLSSFNQQIRKVFFSLPGSVNWYAFLRKQNAEQDTLFSRAGIGGNWYVLHEFIGIIGMADINIGNELQFYARGTSADFQIMGSSDGGFNWLDKEGDLAAVLGGSVATQGSTAIQVVWVV